MELDVFSLSRRSKITVHTDEKATKSDPDGWIVFVSSGEKKNAEWDDAASFQAPAFRALIEASIKRFDFKMESGEVLCVDQGPDARGILAVLPTPREAFFLLELARKALEPLLEFRAREIRVDLRACGECAGALAEAVVAAHLAALHQGKQYGEKPKPAKVQAALTFICLPTQSVSEEALKRTAQVGAATNLVRYLVELAGNDLTPTRYVALTRALAKGQGLKTELYSLDKLEQLKAGAFIAVASGSADRGAGIVKITYRPRAKSAAKTALVGKGITFDTGGTQLKTEHMYGMNGDMGGSAVVLALVLLAAEQKWPWEVTSYLAIAENAIGPKSYRPNDVVRTLRGKTVEVVDADAEGRMVLSDTLWLASKDSPSLILDFATLTGACIRAIGTGYSGAYTNTPEWITKIIEAGKTSGERVWPFPSDSDYGRCLKSDIADIKQCRTSGGSDHIEAGYFLSQFVPEKTPWLHVDLSASEVEDGLAHVPGKITGFGVRFAVEFLRRTLE